MNLNQYILNPLGKKTAVLNATMREYMRTVYSKKFDNVLLKEHGSIRYNLFHDEKTNAYWAYIKIPSEVIKNFYYDVVFKFTVPKDNMSESDLFKFDFKCFSNDPAFVFKFAYVFIQNKMFIDELLSKMSEEAKTDKPTETNPSEEVGYVKSLYFAYLLLQHRGLNKLSRFKAESSPLQASFLINNIEPADSKVASRIEAEKHISHSKKNNTLSQDTYRKAKRIIGNSVDLSNSNLKVATTKTIAPKKSHISNIKRTSAVKTTKRK